MNSNIKNTCTSCKKRRAGINNFDFLTLNKVCNYNWGLLKKYLCNDFRWHTQTDQLRGGWMPLTGSLSLPRRVVWRRSGGSGHSWFLSTAILCPVYSPNSSQGGLSSPVFFFFSTWFTLKIAIVLIWIIVRCPHFFLLALMFDLIIYYLPSYQC